MEKQHGRRQEDELERKTHELEEANILIRKLGKVILSKDEEIKKLRELIANRQRFLPAMPEGNA